MYTKNIIKIESILAKQVEDAKHKVETKKMELEEKYHTEWFERSLSSEEAEELGVLRRNYHELLEAFDDFKNHQW